MVVTTRELDPGFLVRSRFVQLLGLNNSSGSEIYLKSIDTEFLLTAGPGYSKSGTETLFLTLTNVRLLIFNSGFKAGLAPKNPTQKT